MLSRSRLPASCRVSLFNSCDGHFGRQSRNVSTISAIRQGIGKTKTNSLQPNPSLLGRLKTLPDFPSRSPSGRSSPSRSSPISRRKSSEGAPADRWRPRTSPPLNQYADDAPARATHSERGVRREVSKPLAIPYASAASEFLFGRSVVEAALKSKRRKLYKLYHVDDRDSGVAKDAEIRRLLNLAQSRNVELNPLRGIESQRLLDKMSKGRPHNGLVLDASPLGRLPVNSLLSSDPASGTFDVELGLQSSEEAALNGTDPAVRYQSRGSRHPFVLFLDGIVDPGNLGAILRSAFFLGVDAVVTSSHCATLSPVVLKASAGAAEALPLLAVHNTGSFIQASRMSGWKFFAAVPNQTQLRYRRKPGRTLTTLGSPLTDDPCVLMLGGEGPGLWEDLIQRADALLNIEGSRAGQAGIDSLNVSVAAALACHAFMAGAGPKANTLWD